MAEPTHFVTIALTYTVDAINDPGSGIAVPHVENVTIPPYDNQADIDAFVRHAIFEHTLDAIDVDFSDNPFRDALRAMAARLVRLEAVVALLPNTAPRRAELLEVINLSNEEAIERWGETPEG